MQSSAHEAIFRWGAAPQSVAVADLNGDGRPDIVAANNSSANVSVLLNTTPPGAASPSFSAKTDFGVASGLTAVALGDLNGDGRPDIVVASQSTAAVSVLLNTTPPGAAAPSFSATTDLGGEDSLGVALADLNGDGRPDIVATHFATNSVSVLLNTTPPGAAAPTFSTSTAFAVGSLPQSVALADLNGDGRPDMVVASQNANAVSVLLNTTPPGATSPSFSANTSFGVGQSPFGVALADLNGDGRLDVVTANRDSGDASVRLNTTPPGPGTPSFAATVGFPAGANSVGVALADLNGDGKPDVVVANVLSSFVSTFLNITATGALTPSFSARTEVSLASGSTSVALPDVNGDGKPDIVATRLFAGQCECAAEHVPARDRRVQYNRRLGR